MHMTILCTYTYIHSKTPCPLQVPARIFEIKNFPVITVHLADESVTASNHAPLGNYYGK